MTGGRRRPEESREATREPRTRGARPERPEDTRQTPEVAATTLRPEQRGQEQR